VNTKNSFLDLKKRAIFGNITLPVTIFQTVNNN